MERPGQRPPGQHRHGARAGAWASQGDWQAHRHLISHLYGDRHMTLKEVKETMERRYGFFSTERVYKYRFKQWGLAKYTKHTKPNAIRKGGAAQASHPSPSHNAASPASSASRNPYTTTIPKVLLPPGSLRILDMCLSQLRAFLDATPGGQRHTARFDPSYDMYKDRASWTFCVNSAVLEIHRGRLGSGFRMLNASFARLRNSLVAHDTGFPLRLVSALALLTDSGLPGLDTIFLQYAYRCLCIVLSPAHPFSTITRHLLAAAKKRPLAAAWFILAKYSDMLWQCSAPRPPLALTAEHGPGMLELSWDVARSVDREFVLPLAAQVGKVEWLPDAFSVSMAVAQIHLTQRLYAAARCAVDNALARYHPERDPLEVALAYRKRWQISRAEGRRRSAVDADADAFITHCRTTLGTAHYTTARALEEYEGHPDRRRAAGVRSEGTLVPDDGTALASEWDRVRRQGVGLQAKPSCSTQNP